VAKSSITCDHRWKSWGAAATGLFNLLAIKGSNPCLRFGKETKNPSLLQSEMKPIKTLARKGCNQQSKAANEKDNFGD
jgi:hypothetical protein